MKIIWTASSEFGTYRLCEQRRFRRACASAQSRQNLRCSLIQAVNQEEPSDRKPDPWPLWMAGHAQLKFVMTECSKTQIRLTGPILYTTFKKNLQDSHCILKLGVHLLFFLIVVPPMYSSIKRIPSILGVHDKFWGYKKKPLQRVNGNADVLFCCHMSHFKEKLQMYSVITLSFWTDKSRQTVQTLKQLSDQALHCLPVHMHLLDIWASSWENLSSGCSTR